MTGTLRSALDGRLTLVRARAAARAGDLDDAARLLDGLDAATAGTVPALDLRARVHAQRGDLAEADRCWATVLERDPDDADARAGRATIARIRGGRRPRPVLTPGRAVAAGAAALAAAVAAGLLGLPAGNDTPVARPSPARPSPAGPSQAGPSSGGPAVPVSDVERLRRTVASLEADRRAADRALDRLADAAAAPGVRIERRADHVRLVFTTGVFRTGTRLAPGAGPLLTGVGRRLAAARAVTTVVGHTVPVPGGRTRGGSTVAYARAQVAAQRLAAASGLPLTAFTLATADQSDGPYPDAARNRTVTLILRPAG